MSGAIGEFAAGAAVTSRPRSKDRGANRPTSSTLHGFFNTVSPSTYMSNVWSSPGTRAVEPSPKQHATRRQPIDMSNIPRMLLDCTRAQITSRIEGLHPRETPELQRYTEEYL